MFKKIFRDFINNHFVRGVINRNDRQGALHKIWGHIFTNHLFGDYVEFGVYKGDSFLKSINEYKKFISYFKSEKNSSEKWRKEMANNFTLNNDIFFHGLDTFSGMPENNEGNFTFAEGTFYSNFDEVNKLILQNFENYKLYKGLFSQTKDEFHNNLKNRKVAIANIDCDIYQSSVEALEIVKDYLMIGSIVMFDDFNCFNADNSKGERRAFKEFQNISPYIFEPFFSYHYVGQCFLVTGLK